MAICPFMSKSSKPDDWSGCITCCGLYVQGYCALNVIAQKMLHDAKVKKQSNAKVSNLQRESHDSLNN